MRTFAVCTLLALLALPAAGLDPHLVEDINQEHDPAGSYPAGFAALGGLALFSASDGTEGRALWRSDGTGEGTWKVQDLLVNLVGSGEVAPFAVTDRLYFFTVNEDPYAPWTLWVTDGTPGGTVRLGLEVEPGALWVPSQGVLYFSASDLEHGQELWRSDGTPEGTYLVADLLPGEDGSQPQGFTFFKGRVWFGAADGRVGALWSTDGTPAGTRRVKGFGEAPYPLAAVGGRLVFMAPGLNGGYELWASDGTRKGTRPISNLTRDGSPPLLYDFALVGGSLYVVVADSRRGQELWVTDGTAGGTRRLTSFARRDAFFDSKLRLFLPRTLTGGRLVFAAHDGPHGAELWISDGTPQGTRLLRDLCPGTCSGVASVWRTHQGFLYFAATDGSSGQELWATDGTAAGTRLVHDLCPGSCGSRPAEPFFLPERVVFKADDGSHGVEVWSTDGTVDGSTAAGTVRLARPQPSFPFLGAVVEGELFFAGDDDLHGTELWRTDGTPEGTSLVRDINPRELGASSPILIGALGGLGFFFADDGVQGYGLWKSDGTAAGTVLVSGEAEPLPGLLPPRPRSEVVGGLLFFQAQHRLWRTDGTAPGTFPVSGESFQPCCSQEAFRAFDGRLWFPAFDAAHGWELWVSDGTVEGTRLFADLRPGEPDSQPAGLTVFQGSLYFTAAGADGVGELWRTDGTGAGTVRVLGSNPGFLTVHADRLWFFALDGELWSSDGTAAGTGLAVDIGPGSFFPLLMVSLGDRLLISGSSGGDFGLWATDGTPGGTGKIGPALSGVFGAGQWTVFKERLYYPASQPPGPDSPYYVSDGTPEGTKPLHGPDGSELFEIVDFAPLGDLLLFLADSGRTLWATDGTDAGTFRVVEEGFELLDTRDLLAAGPRVFLPAYGPGTGVELWAVEANTP